jgi:excisionase family DNA binding protein
LIQFDPNARLTPRVVAVLTVAEAAHYLRLNPRSIYLLAQRGAIPASRVTGNWLFPVHLLDPRASAPRPPTLAGEILSGFHPA